MAHHGGPELPARSPRFDDDLVGLDPDDPEAQAFAAHLDRMQRLQPAYTVEGSLAGVREFAESANRAEGGRRLLAVVVVALLLLGVLYVLGDVVVSALAMWG